MKTYFLSYFLLLGFLQLNGQIASLNGRVLNDAGEGLAYANISITDQDFGTTTDENGSFILKNLNTGSYEVIFSYLGYQTAIINVEIDNGQKKYLEVVLKSDANILEEVVVTGTLKEVNRLESPVPVEVYRSAIFKKNPTPNVYESLQIVNGVRPQLNCQVCNTGDIHINGLEGPYTMILIDGMPIVSSLAAVYGLSGIPNSLIDRLEIVKGPASSLFGSEAIGGLINIITKNPDDAPIFSGDVMMSSWNELNTDLGWRFKINKTANVLTGVNYFRYNNPIDKNDDNFTDVTLQHRVSVFQKWNILRKDKRLFSLAGRYNWEDRWGGEMQWTKADRGGDEIYGESIRTNRWEVLGQYQLPTTENLLLSFSYNFHDQNSVYGTLPYLGRQQIGFSQLTWDKKIGINDLLLGAAIRYTWYDDNTPATFEQKTGHNQPDKTWLPGIFIQDEIQLSPKHNLLLGLRCDYNDAHGNIITPRLAYKWAPQRTSIFRINAGTGFRVVNLFTEDHASLTGARDIVITESLKPERSYNVNANFIKKIYAKNGSSASIELSSWYTYFTNIILPDYETNTSQIIYDNLNGKATSKGLSFNADYTARNGISIILGATLMDVNTEENGICQRQILTERFNGTWVLSSPLWNHNFTLDYTGNIYGPMRLPLLGNLDPRPHKSPWWSIQNIQLTYKGFKSIEVYGGVKNLLNWTPWKDQEASIIARPFDPFDRNVLFDGEGNPIPTPNNPYGLTFDPSYVYAPNQGIRLFFGMRYAIND